MVKLDVLKIYPRYGLFAKQHQNFIDLVETETVSGETTFKFEMHVDHFFLTVCFLSNISSMRIEYTVGSNW